jgi:hypothetical protein
MRCHLIGGHCRSSLIIESHARTVLYCKTPCGSIIVLDAGIDRFEDQRHIVDYFVVEWCFFDSSSFQP